MTTQTTIIELPTAALQPDPHNRTVDVDKQLRNSIAEIGVQTPLRVRQHPSEPDAYEIVAGERRWRAATAAGLDNVPCILFDGDDGERIVAQAIENFMRQDFTPVEEGRVFLRAVEADITIKELAARLGFSAALVKRRIALLDLPAEALAKLDSGEWTISDADEVAKHVNNDEIANRLAQLKRKSLIADRTEELTANGGRVCQGDSFHMWSAETALEQLGIDPADHASEPCHAIGLRVPHGTTELTEIPCCTDKQRHSPTTDSDSVIQSPKLAERTDSGPSAAQLKQQRIAREATEARQELLRDAKTHGAAFIDILALHIVTGDMWNVQPKEVCEWLDIGTVPEGEPDPGWEHWNNAFDDHIAAGDSKSLRDAAVAIVALSDCFAMQGVEAEHRLLFAQQLPRFGWKPTKQDRSIIKALEAEAKANRTQDHPAKTA